MVTPDRLFECADALDRVEQLHQRGRNYPNFLKIDWPQDEGGGSITITYADLAAVFRAAVLANARLDATALKAGK